MGPAAAANNQNSSTANAVCRCGTVHHTASQLYAVILHSRAHVAAPAGIAGTNGNMCFTADVSNEAEVKALMHCICEQYGRLDYCFNNAGIEGDRALVQDYPTEMFDKVQSGHTTASGRVQFNQSCRGVQAWKLLLHRLICQASQPDAPSCCTECTAQHMTVLLSAPSRASMVCGAYLLACSCVYC